MTQTIAKIAETNTEEIVAALIEEMESHDPNTPYTPGWITALHKNVNGYEYKGWNQFHLNFKYGHLTPIWGTFHQWKNIGLYTVAGTGLPLWQRIPIVKKDKETEEDKVVGSKFKTIPIFNIDHVKGNKDTIIELKKNLIPVHNNNMKAERIHRVDDDIATFINNHNINFVEGSNKACYVPSEDKVMMPLYSSFKRVEHYYSVFFHELTHWSGHSKRLNRDLSGKFGSKDYAFEELIAELGASFHMARWGLFHQTRKDHAMYLKSWAKALRDKPEALRSACKYASDSYFYLQQNSESLAVINEDAVNQ